MTRNAFAYAVIIAGLLVPAASYAANSNAPYDQGGTNPAQSNCDSKTGCASYATGNRTRATPVHSRSHSSTADENRVTAQLNQQQLAGGTGSAH
ncbi:MAG TPA: hypothetical protein VG328_19700 [Stellaceae bacterium]|jgi:hypothetical protein|nr:hypothetical protein [Stellaceae bacterium]